MRPRLLAASASRLINIPRLGEVKTSVIVTTGVIDIFRQAMILSEQDGLKYNIRGTIYLNSLMRSITFTHQGNLINALPKH